MKSFLQIMLSVCFYIYMFVNTRVFLLHNHFYLHMQHCHYSDYVQHYLDLKQLISDWSVVFNEGQVVVSERSMSGQWVVIGGK